MDLHFPGALSSLGGGLGGALLPTSRGVGLGGVEGSSLVGPTESTCVWEGEAGRSGVIFLLVLIGIATKTICG